MYLSQMFGSNNALISIGGLFFATFFYQIFLSSNKIKLYFANSVLHVKSILFGIIAKRTISITILLVLIFFVTGLFSVYYFNIDLSRYRIFAFGHSDENALSSRWQMLENYPEQLDYSPILGNMAVDRLTTGSGTYAHSFILSLLSHLGLIGFVIFFSYLYLAFKEKMNFTQEYTSNRYVQNSMTYYSFLVFLGIFLIASIGVFITWIPLWFLLGLLFTPIKLQKDL